MTLNGDFDIKSNSRFKEILEKYEILQISYQKLFNT